MAHFPPLILWYDHMLFLPCPFLGAGADAHHGQLPLQPEQPAPQQEGGTNMDLDAAQGGQARSGAGSAPAVGAGPGGHRPATQGSAPAPRAAGALAAQAAARPGPAHSPQSTVQGRREDSPVGAGSSAGQAGSVGNPVPGQEGAPGGGGLGQEGGAGAMQDVVPGGGVPVAPGGGVPVAPGGGVPVAPGGGDAEEASVSDEATITGD